MTSLTPWRRSDGDDARLMPLSRLRWDVDRLFDRFLDWPSGMEGMGFADVRLDVSETEEEIVVRAEVPGIDPKDLDIELVGDILTLSGEKTETFEDGDDDKRRRSEKGDRSERTSRPHYSERRFGSFRRSIQLPMNVEPEGVRAEHKNGVVTIRLKKAASARPRRIQIKSG